MPAHLWQTPGRSSLLRLPAQATNFIGREREVEEVRRLLGDGEARIVTLLGPPGIGKTRLSLQAAAGLATSFPHGIFFVPLASIKDAALALHEIARAVGVREEWYQSIAKTLGERLQGKKMLLVLDNFEHLPAAAADVAGLATAAPDLKMLVTSRVALHAYGEYLFRVPPMSFPNIGAATDLGEGVHLEALSQFEAIRLFVQRARSVQHGFEITRKSSGCGGYMPQAGRSSPCDRVGRYSAPMCFPAGHSGEIGAEPGPAGERSH